MPKGFARVAAVSVPVHVGNVEANVQEILSAMEKLREKQAEIQSKKDEIVALKQGLIDSRTVLEEKKATSSLKSDETPESFDGEYKARWSNA